ncbi:MAG: hypothetical protein HPY89_12080 [Pelotomaculum sp.]|nr:hypothetical protein [Pelotomaculum sp.]
MFRKGFIALLLTVVLVLGTAAASQAAPGKKANWKFKFHGARKAVQLTDIQSHWAAQPIQTLFSYGIITGYSDLTFRPNIPVTKYEAIMMIARASGFDGTSEADLAWDGAPEWMAACLDFAVSEGILTEEEAEDLNGWAPAKRYEVAVWAARAMGLEPDGRFSFQDLGEIPSFARPYVGGMFKCGYMIGYPGNFFQPNKPVTRAEMAVVIYRILMEDTIDGEDRDDQGSSDTGGEPAVESLEPADGSGGVDAETVELTVRFNVAVEAVEDLESVREGITVRNLTDGEVVEVDDVSIAGDTLTIELGEPLENGKTYRVTIDGGLIEAEESGANFGGIGSGRWEFSTGGDFEIVGLNPADGADDVDGEDTAVLKAEFSGDIRVIPGKTLLDAVKVYNLSDDEDVDVDMVEIDGDTLVITLEDPLESGDTFEVTIEGGYLEEEDTGRNFEGLEGGEWRFTTAG